MIFLLLEFNKLVSFVLMYWFGIILKKKIELCIFLVVWKLYIGFIFIG